MAFVPNCPICLDTPRDPVVTPCGHLGCDGCIKAHVRRSSDPYTATCPTCRAPFPIVTPDVSFVPNKYRAFFSPPLRRVFLCDAPDNNNDQEVIEDLNLQVSRLKKRVRSLRCEKDYITDCCDAAVSERERLEAECDELKSRCARNHQACSTRTANAKRTSNQAALDDSSSSSGSSSDSSSESDFEPGSSTLRSFNVSSNGRVTKPAPKRARP